MHVKKIIDEWFSDYKKPSMFICTCTCDWKCCIEGGFDVTVCQNSEIAKLPTLNIQDSTIVDRYLNNPITSAIVIGGLEPFLQFKELHSLIKAFREETDDDIVIYTGYYPKELAEILSQIKERNIVIKYGRFKQNSTKKYDDILGVTLISNNQYTERLN